MRRIGIGRRAGPRISVYFVTAGDIASFRAVEGFAATSIDNRRYAVHVSDIFLPA